MKKYRTVGVKGGKKNSFSMPAKGDNTKVKIGKTKTTTKKSVAAKRQIVKTKKQSSKKATTKNKKKAINLRSLQPRTKITDYKPKTKSKNLVSRMSQKDMARVRLPKVTVQSVQRQKGMKRDLMKQLGPGTTTAKVANKSDIQVHFEPPEGISEDELNSVEKMFYSFQKRTFEGYFNSFITTYNRVIQLRPRLKKTLNREVHHLTGRVTFDRNGNIVSIKILRWSQDDNLQKLFEETLKEIKSLPNPPKDILGKNEQFNIYYQLKIN
ncbi:MAG: TonB C-terminal domain-containing protein [Bacteriovoracaceae bacterium]|nr:TonB C-terminal domain-containing protein [Bacteriovoracaceae bacterium]